MQAALQTRRGGHEVLDVRLQIFQMLLAVAHPEVSVALLVLLLHLRGLRVVFIVVLLLTVLRLGSPHLSCWLLGGRGRRRRRTVMDVLLQLVTSASI